MDELTNLMRLIDLNSEVIPEGNYLEMCNSIKKVHDTMSRSNSNDDSESDDDEQFRIREIYVVIYKHHFQHREVIDVDITIPMMIQKIYRMRMQMRVLKIHQAKTTMF